MRSITPQTVEAAGSRIGAVVPLDEAADRIALQASASAVWVELTRDGGPAMDRLLQQVCSDATDGRYPAVVAAPRELVDLLFLADWRRAGRAGDRR